MSAVPAIIPTASLATAPANRGQIRAAWLLCLALSLLTLGLLPVATVLTGRVPAFLPIYQTTVILCYALTAYLLFGHFRDSRMVSLLWVGGGALYTAAILLFQLLSFPNLLASGRLLGDGPATTTWLWTFWHLGPPVYALGFALSERGGSGRQCAPNQAMLLVRGTCATVVALVAITMLIVTEWVGALPTIVDGDDYRALATSGVGPAVELLTIVALAVLWRTTRFSTVLQLWLAVSLLTLILDNGLTLAGGARGSVGWTFGRLEALVSASFLVAVYLRELGILHRRTAADARRLAEQSAVLASNARELVAARAAAEAAADAKSQFLATMSHELRTPLTGIIGFADLLLKDDLAPVDRQRFLELQRGAAHSLLAVVNDILDFSKIEAGKLELESIPFDVLTLADACAGIVAESAREKGLALSVEVTPEVPVWLAGDPQRLRQILLNLLTNAVKFTKAGSVALVISRAASANDPSIRFSVRDTGIGIPRGKIGRLFQQFSQVDGSTSREYGGSGLGLAICRRLVAMMGGEIGVDSTVGRGSTFWFELPLPVAQPQAQSQASAIRAEPRRQRRRILLAEDVEANQILIVSVLTRAGHHVDVRSDGAAAVAAARRTKFDLVLMDTQMPVMNGLDATRAIRASEPTGHRVPILALSADVTPEAIWRCTEAGTDGYLTKPIDPERLLLAIDRAIAGQPVELPADRSEAAMPILDVARLDTLISLIGADKVRELIGLFRRSLADGVTAIRRLGNDHEGKAWQAHELAGAAGTLGCARLDQICRQLMTADARALDDRGVDRLVEIARESIAALDQRFPPQPAPTELRLVAAGGGPR